MTRSLSTARRLLSAALILTFPLAGIADPTEAENPQPSMADTGSAKQQYEKLVEQAHQYCADQNERGSAKMAQVCSGNTHHCERTSGGDPGVFRDCVRDRGVRL